MKIRLVEQFEGEHQNFTKIDVNLQDDIEAESNSDKKKNIETILRMPIFVRNFSESMMPEDKREEINFILAEWYESKLHNLYVISQNVRYTKVKSGKYNKIEVAKELEKMETNLKAFIERMVHKY